MALRLHSNFNSDDKLRVELTPNAQAVASLPVTRIYLM